MKNKIRLFVMAGLLSVSFAEGQAVLESEKKKAGENQQLILLYFSGSDWCVPCIKLHRDYFDNEGFKKMADSLLILVNADFPRNKKNQQDVNTRKRNEALADKFNPKGIFPYTLLLDAHGEIIKAWDGLPRTDAAAFTSEVRALCMNNKK